MEAKPNKKASQQFLRKVDQALLDKILKDISKGAPNKYAAEANGISARHFYYLIAQGIVDLEYDKNDTIHAGLVRSLREIEMKEIQECRSAIKSDEKGHKGAEWTLEHAYWRQFGKDANAKELADEIERLREDLRNGASNGDTDSSKEKEDSES